MKFTPKTVFFGPPMMAPPHMVPPPDLLPPPYLLAAPLQKILDPPLHYPCHSTLSHALSHHAYCAARAQTGGAPRSPPLLPSPQYRLSSRRQPPRPLWVEFCAALWRPAFIATSRCLSKSISTFLFLITRFQTTLFPTTVRKSWISRGKIIFLT